MDKLKNSIQTTPLDNNNLFTILFHYIVGQLVNLKSIKLINNLL